MIKAINASAKQCETMLPALKAAGFDGIDMALQDGFMADGWEKRVERILELLEDNDMCCAQVHLPFYGIFASSEIYDPEIEKQIKNSFKAMKMLGAKWGAFHPQSATGFDYDRNRAMHDNTEKLKNYLEEAVKYGTGIAVENIPVFPDCPQYNFFSSNIDDHAELVDGLNSDLVKICWDFGHANLMSFDTADALRKLGERVKILHVHNNNGMCDWHVAPSIGTHCWDGTVKALSDIGYDGPLSLEINFSLVPEERMQSYVKYLGEDAEWLKQKFEQRL